MRPFKTLLTLTLSFGISAGVLLAEPQMKSGETLAFMGDSITQFGAQSDAGYVKLVESGLAANGITIKILPAGISGNKSDQMLARLKGQVLDKKPEWMTLSCGVNDVWHGPKGIPLEDYKKNITEIITQCEQSGVKVIILTSTPINEIDNENNKKLADYNEFLRQLAAEHKLPLADLSADMWAELNKPTQPRPPGNFLTVDGVHMNPLGNVIMATGVLKAIGLNDAQLAKAREAWAGKNAPILPKGVITLQQYQQLNALAAQQNKTVDQVLTNIVQDAVAEAVAKAPKTP